MYRMNGRRAKVLGAVFVLPMGLISTGGAALAATPSTALRSLDAGAQSSRPFIAHVILSGSTLNHTYTPQGGAPATEALSDPDDITLLGDDIFVGFQNGVGPQGQPSSDGNLDSTVVELKMNGDPVAQWDVQGKTDGVTADPQAGDVIATVNEDANSSLYTIDPTAPAGAQVTHYNYNEPLPHFGGTDAISIYRGQILISASAPGTTGAAAPQKTYPAVYSAVLDAADNTATVTPLFFDEDSATVVNAGSSYGHTTTLGLTDPDSNEVVPPGARFGGDFMLTSQGDQEQIYVRNAGTRRQSLSVLSLSQSVDDTAWPTSSRGPCTRPIRQTTPLTASGGRSALANLWWPLRRAGPTVLLPPARPHPSTRPITWPRSTRTPARSPPQRWWEPLTCHRVVCSLCPGGSAKTTEATAPVLRSASRPGALGS